MGQNAPLNQQKNLQGLSGFGQPQGASAQAQAPYGAMDPQMIAARLMLNNRNNDKFAPGQPATGAEGEAESPANLLPNPIDMAIGAAAGVPIGLGIQEMQKRGWFMKAARFLDRKIPGVNWLSDSMDKGIGDLKGKWADRLFMRYAYKETPEAAVTALRSTMTPENMQMVMKKSSKGRGLVGHWGDILKDISGKATHAEFDDAIKKQLANLDELAKQKPAKGFMEWWRRHRTHNELSKLSAFYNHLEKNLVTQEVQTKLIQGMKKEGIGPIGRAFAGFTNAITRIMGGDAFTESMPGMAKKAGQDAAEKGLAMKLFGPLISGALMFGQSLTRARKAKEGEKIQTFFHDFIGVGIASFIGWELGRNTLNKFKVFDRILGPLAKRSPFGLLRNIPLLGGLARVTLAGFATEIVAMFLVGWLFQKVGEKLAHKIFGKPSDESLDPKKKAQSLPPGQNLRNHQVFNQIQNSQAMQAPAGTMPSQQAQPGGFSSGVSSLSPQEIMGNTSASRPGAYPETGGAPSQIPLVPDWMSGADASGLDSKPMNPYSQKGLFFPQDNY